MYLMQPDAELILGAFEILPAVCRALAATATPLGVSWGYYGIQAENRYHLPEIPGMIVDELVKGLLTGVENLRTSGFLARSRRAVLARLQVCEALTYVFRFFYFLSDTYACANIFQYISLVVNSVSKFHAYGLRTLTVEFRGSGAVWIALLQCPGMRYFLLGITVEMELLILVQFLIQLFG